MRLLRETGEIPPCILEGMEQYNEDDCSEVGQLQKCMWDVSAIKKWGVLPPKNYQKIFESVTEKDLVVPSDGILHRLSYYAGENYLPMCLYEAFKKIRYCREPCSGC